MGIYSIKPKFQQFLSPLNNFLIKNKVHPTIINISALIISILAGVAFYYSAQYPFLLLYIPIMAFVRTALNALDGMVARELKVKNMQFGEVLNEFFDRISDASIFLGIAFSGYVSIGLGVIVLVIILLNSYLSIVSKAAGGSRQYGGFMGKADRMIYVEIMAGVILLLNNFSIANYFVMFIGIGTLVTMFERFMTIKSELYK